MNKCRGICSQFESSRPGKVANSCRNAFQIAVNPDGIGNSVQRQYLDARIVDAAGLAAIENNGIDIYV